MTQRCAVGRHQLPHSLSVWRISGNDAGLSEVCDVRGQVRTLTRQLADEKEKSLHYKGVARDLKSKLDDFLKASRARKPGTSAVRAVERERERERALLLRER
jgi:hypothetical protein